MGREKHMRRIQRQYTTTRNKRRYFATYPPANELVPPACKVKTRNLDQLQEVALIDSKDLSDARPDHDWWDCGKHSVELLGQARICPIAEPHKQPYSASRSYRIHLAYQP